MIVVVVHRKMNQNVVYCGNILSISSGFNFTVKSPIKCRSTILAEHGDGAQANSSPRIPTPRPSPRNGDVSMVKREEPNMRKARFGGYTVERRYVAKGVWEYRVSAGESSAK